MNTIYRFGFYKQILEHLRSRDISGDSKASKVLVQTVRVIIFSQITKTPKNFFCM